jgi:hypothetical protein
MTTNGIPRLSQTMIGYLINASPLHAWWNNAILNPDYEPEVSPAIDIGQICHARILLGEDVTTVLDYKDYRTNAAQEARDEARRAGKWPILKKDVGKVEEIVEATNLQLEYQRDAKNAFSGGEAEVRLTWTDDLTGLDCKARLDYLSGDKTKIFDLKCTGASAHPEAVSKRIFQMGYDIQACFYQEAVMAVHSIEAEFYLITVETNPPYALSVVGLDPSAKWIGQKKCEKGKQLWQESLTTGHWAGYPSQTCWVTLPAWAEKAWLEREEAEL